MGGGWLAFIGYGKCKDVSPGEGPEVKLKGKGFGVEEPGHL